VNPRPFESGSASRPCAAIVLAAGEGKRMKSRRPKVLHTVLGAPLLRFPLDALDAAGIERKIVVVGVGREEVEKVFRGRPGIEFAIQDRPLGTGHAVLAAREALSGFEGDILVLPGDAPCVRPGFFQALLGAHSFRNDQATVVTAEAPDPAGYGRIVRDEEGRILDIVEDRDASEKERAIREVNASIYAFRAAALWPALERVENDNRAGEYYLTDVVRILFAEGRRVGTFSAPFSEVEGVNDRRQLAEAARVLRERILIDLMREKGVTIVDPATTWIEVDVEIGPDTTIEPFSVIRRGARIGAGCHIGPFAQLGEGTVLEDGVEIGNFVEVKRTRAGAGAKAKHLAYLGDGQIGPGVNIGAGTIFCNYDGRKKHSTVVGEGAFLGSGSLLVAPVEIGPRAVLGAGAVVTRGKKVPAGETWVGVPARPVLRRQREGGGS
jgi:bifunctional UDP-N-acetylglucosamine pyrophosphorylase/glucosamine-1-phosphate N-acetyltransferase